MRNCFYCFFEVFILFFVKYLLQKTCILKAHSVELNRVFIVFSYFLE